MCGLTGILAPRGHRNGGLGRLVQKMTSTLSHRGPDAEGIWTEDAVGLGHRRLSIVDLSSAGAQPMHSACGRYVIAFNGEIYNHLDLRQELGVSGIEPEWRGHSDTETLLAGIAHWGIEKTLRQASGMFAMALWDRKEQRLTLARDRMGEKPLYWGWAGTDLIFGSELKALRAHPHCPSSVCREALAQYLSLGYVPAPRSIHPGLYKLEPGCLLEVDATGLPAAAPRRPLRPGDSSGGLNIRRFWSLDRVIQAGAEQPLTDEASAVDMVEATLAAAVGRQMVADVPLGAFLSGGIDSSLIVALMQRQSRQPIQTYTVGFEAKEFDESPHAAAVAGHLGTNHTAIHVTEAEAREVIPLLPELYDEPFADSSQIPTHLVCRAARSGVTVALSGDAGDELFGGYNRHVFGPRLWNRIAPMPVALRRWIASAALALPEHAWDRLGQLHNAMRPSAGGISAMGQKVHRIAERLRRAQSVDALHRDIISVWPAPTPLRALEGGHSDGSSPEAIATDPLPPCLDADAAGRMMALDMRGYLPDDILCKVDRAAMGIGLETRVPFLDPAVIALAARIPVGMKIRDGQGKWILRQVLYRHVPRGLIDRPKTGFAVPLASWLRGPLRGWAEDLLSPTALASEGLLDPQPIREVWTEHLSGRVDRSAQLWIILMFMAWRAGQAKSA
ncbi:asparagine synthase (glutamine-hydrolyzing) [Ancylobacter aquaticus]|nr:asparagine synthase (glutamine-hydrolyzing) [Ancylobacter aquaticus]